MLEWADAEEREAKFLTRPSAILDLWRKYTVFCLSDVRELDASKGACCRCTLQWMPRERRSPGIYSASQRHAPKN